MEISAAAFSITNSPLDKLKAKRDAKKKASERPAAGEAANISGSSDIGAEKAGPTAVSGAEMGDSKSKDTLPTRTQEAAQNGTDTKSPATKTGAPADDPKDPLVNTFIWSCDGPCRTDPVDWEALYFCGYCLDTCFCDRCFELLKTDKMPYRKCDKNHEFFQGYPVKDVDRMKAVATVKGSSGRLEPNMEWLEDLRKAWGASNA